MLCIGEPVTDQTTGEFLTYFGGQARTYGTQRIGLTSPNRRVIPMTRDYQYVAGRLGDLAGLSREQADGAADDAASFSPAVTYVDYASSVEDILALCITGFPSFDSKSPRRRSLIYLGPGQIRDPGEARRSLLSAAQVSGMANDAGVQINALTSTGQGAGALPFIAKSSGGQFFSFDPRDAQLAGDLDSIRKAPPPAGASAGAAVTGWFGDAPAIPLTVALVASALLCLSLAVLRR